MSDIGTYYRDIEVAMHMLAFLNGLGIASAKPNLLWASYMTKLSEAIAAS